MTKNYRSTLLIFLAFSFLAAIFTYPLVFKFGGAVYGYPGDNFAYLNYLWGFKEGFPGRGVGISAPLLDLVVKALTLIFNEVVAFNLLSFLRFPLAGLAMYFLCWKILRGPPIPSPWRWDLQTPPRCFLGEQLETPERNLFRIPGMLAGFIFSFSLYSLWQGMVHIDLALIFWLPLFVLCLLNLWEVPNFKNAFWVALVFALTFTTSFYYGYFLALFSIGFFIFTVISKITWHEKFSFTLFLASGLISLALIFPVLYPILTQSEKRILVTKIAESRNPEQLVSLGAKPWDYLMPSNYHPVFGEWVERFYNYNQEEMQWYLHSAYLPERVVFLGFTPLILAFLAFWWGRKDERFKKYVWLFGFLALWCAWISAPSYTFIKGIKVYFPSYFLYKLFPMFRVYARMGILVLLCVAVLSGIGLVLLIEKLQQVKDQKLRKFLISSFLFLIFFLIFFENLNFPPFHVTDVSLRPPVYEWLAKQPGDVTVVEYPVDTSGDDFGGGCPDWLDPEIRREYTGYYSDLFQRIHGKEVLDYGSLSAEEKAMLVDPSKPDAYEVLSSREVDYIIIHTRDYFPRKNPFDECQERRVIGKPEKVFEGFELVREFEDAAVYEVN